MKGSVVSDQDIAPFADFPIPGVVAGASEDWILGYRCPVNEWPSGRGLSQILSSEAGRLRNCQERERGDQTEARKKRDTPENHL
jgi:hypothetical protein